MNYLFCISLSCWLAITTTAVIAAGSVNNRWAISGEPSATIEAFPSVHFTVTAPSQEPTQSVLIEGFWPFMMQQQEQLLFLQGAWQRQQQHNLLSIGLGWRYCPETDWGVGYNLFYDQESMGQQRRWGLGAEAWLHALTLAVNGYLPANRWQTAHDLKEYQRCPASGYDVTLWGYLPALPHLGASLHYARYGGDEVALGSGQQRYRNPQQWRWGIDITPIPLLTLAYHQHAGFSAQATQQISVVLTYRFSLSLSQQLDPNQVTALHSAEGQRLARVQHEQVMALKHAALNHDKTLDLEEAASRTEQIIRVEEPIRTEAAVRPEAMRLKTNSQEETKITGDSQWLAKYREAIRKWEIKRKKRLKQQEKDRQRRSEFVEKLDELEKRSERRQQQIIQSYRDRRCRLSPHQFYPEFLENGSKLPELAV